ncbi:phage head morphogenesis protein [Bosea sp. MMO-172]|uniref:phage head morphogenesis protein n=1 Tax=Bosea sp. MMO-172 TaxID=3127885 RepID=UPI003018C170
MAVEDLFATAPKPVVEYFDRRPSKPSFRWDEVAPREHALGFTVARTAGFDVLDDIRAATRKAVVDRIPFAQFRDELMPVLKAKGWWGEKKVIDPRTGEIAKVQLGSLRRLDLIYDANIRSAEAAGDWSRIQRVKDALPYLEYLTSTSERKRPLHLSWVGTTLPVDDAWWSTHYPPNGWRCKCRVRSRAMPREGAQLDRPALNLRPWENGTTGERRLVPAGIDPGWDNNPGKVREQMASRRLVDRLDRMGSEARRAAVEMLRRDPVFAYVTENGARFDHRRRLDPEQAGAGRLRWPVAVLPDPLASQLGTTTRTVALSVADAAKIGVKHREIGPEFWAALQQGLDRPEAVARGDKLRVVFRIDGKPHIVVLKRTSAEEVLLNSAHRIEEWQADKLRGEEAAGGA